MLPLEVPQHCDPSERGVPGGESATALTGAGGRGEKVTAVFSAGIREPQSLL